ncbi:hemolysin XhlA family protein [Bacillus sp. Au-Bac7]|uniref:hemolysin XhlA family protein n=1 Tax=Bacillus sp. Au-Bac7 TaxID=2906458 RepID=UPI001E356E21|nr:hemolysin XhlA family protein [Bacillus sp. Au-Bac7]MCE4052036.1 hemolysin XhlA family protein [Bacillus sp. Au-Bac7]
MSVETEVQSPLNKEFASKAEFDILAKEVRDIQREQDKQSGKIDFIEKQLVKIEENTTWIKRTITAALITAVCTGVIGGAIALFYGLLQK